MAVPKLPVVPGTGATHVGDGLPSERKTSEFEAVFCPAARWTRAAEKRPMDDFIVCGLLVLDLLVS